MHLMNLIDFSFPRINENPVGGRAKRGPGEGAEINQVCTHTKIGKQKILINKISV